MNETLKKITKILQAHDIDFWIANQTKIGIKASDCEDIPELISLIGSFLSNNLSIKTCGSLAWLFILEVSGIDLVWFYDDESGSVKGVNGFLSREKMLKLIEENKKLLNE